MKAGFFSAFNTQHTYKNILDRVHSDRGDKWSSKVLKLFMPSYSMNCYALSQQQRETLMSKPTDVYVWGNGKTVDVALDYSNFYPKKISNFSTPDSPQIIIVKFGEFHEAYLDKTGKVHLCKKHRLPSMKLKGADDCARPDMQILEIPQTKIIDIGKKNPNSHKSIKSTQILKE